MRSAESHGAANKYPKLIQFQLNGIQVIDLYSVEQREVSWKNVSTQGYVAGKIAALGADGWEMVSAVSAPTFMGTGGLTTLYFRRQVESDAQ